MDCTNKMNSIIAASRINKNESSEANEKAEKDSSSWATDLKEVVKPKCAKSKADNANPNLAGDRRGNSRSEHAASRTSVWKLRRDSPNIGAARPGFAKLRKEKLSPKCAGSSTSIKESNLVTLKTGKAGSRRTRVCTGIKEPACKESSAGDALSSCAKPLTSINKPEQPESKTSEKGPSLDFPNKKNEESKRVWLRGNNIDSSDKRSSENVTGSRFAELRRNDSSPKHA